jgi:hypothetical protein
MIPMLLVKNITMDGEETGFSSLDLSERIDIVKGLPKKVFMDLLELSTSEKFNPAQLLYRTIECPACANKIQYDMDVRYFFI